MVVGEVIYFSSNYHMTMLDFDNENLLLKAFEERVEEFYLSPAEKLVEPFEAFSKGVLILTAIDFVGKFLIGKENSYRIMEFCRGLRGIKDQSTSEVEFLVKKINEDYRNGLIHEGRIKNLGQFSFEFNELIKVENLCSVINPTILLDETRIRFSEYLKIAKDNKEEMHKFKMQMITIFKPEVDRL